MRKQSGYSIIEPIIITALVAIGVVTTFSYMLHHASMHRDAFEETLLSATKLTPSNAQKQGGDNWAYLETAHHMLLNGSQGASVLCPTLAGVDNPPTPGNLSLFEDLASRKQLMRVSLFIPRPSDKLFPVKGCSGLEEKTDHYEYRGKVVGFPETVAAILAHDPQSAPSK